MFCAYRLFYLAQSPCVSTIAGIPDIIIPATKTQPGKIKWGELNLPSSLFLCLFLSFLVPLFPLTVSRLILSLWLTTTCSWNNAPC